MGPVGEAIEGAVGQDGVVGQRDPLLDRAVARDDRGGVAVPLDEDVVEVAGLLGGKLSEAEVVHGQGVPGEPATQLVLEGVVGPRACRA